jgi:hypothetical protein
MAALEDRDGGNEMGQHVEAHQTSRDLAAVEILKSRELGRPVGLNPLLIKSFT